MNYFKASGHIFTFNEDVNTSEAYFAAKACGGQVSVYRVTKAPGVWDRAAVIGHRSRANILFDLNTEDTPEIRDELEALECCYRRAGRKNMPLFAVAA